MSFTSQLLGNSTNALTVSERAAQAHAAFERGQVVNTPTTLYDRINNAIGDFLTPDRSNADEYAKRFIDNSYLDVLRDNSSRAHESAKRAGESTADDVADAFNRLVDGFKSTSAASSGATYSANRSAKNSAKTVDYLEADLAKHYGMDANAAYGEALQNTAYRRAVADLKAAGLNPVLAVSGLNPAGSYVSGNTLSRASGSGSSGRVSSSSGKYAMSSNLYNAIGAAATIVGGIIGFKTGNPDFKWMNAATVASFTKTIAQAAIQGYGSLFGSK